MPALSVRTAEPRDSELIWRWRNDPVVREHSLSSEPVPWSDHEAWFARSAGSADVAIYLLEADAAGPVAQVRYTRAGPALAEVHVTVAPEMRGRGYGKAVLTDTRQLACEKLGAREVEAHVVKTNPASMQLFRSAGYDQVGDVVKGGRECARFVWKFEAK